MKRISRRGKMESVISLINIVFLILIFFMVTGTLSKQRDGGLTFIQTKGLECCADPDALTLSRDGILARDGETFASPSAYLAAQNKSDVTVKLLPDQALPARQLLAIIQELQAAGADRILVLTENTPT